MPIYEYEVACDGGCKACGGRFELRRPADRPELTTCPLCKKPVRRVISLSSTPRVLKPLSVSDAKKAGFTVFEKRDKGVYERQQLPEAACVRNRAAPAQTIPGGACAGACLQ